ncbi:MAG: fibronectin type III domain-containing protein [ANME-2 cluster archaeon]|nr:fibronectin type III domain-containing protein [ANME-2 cluster archaeon]
MLNIQNRLIVVFLILFIVFNTGTVSATSDCLDCHAETVTIMPDIENPHLLPEPAQTVSSMSTTGSEVGILSASSPPLVYDITSRGKATTAFIAWKTNESTDNRVYFGTDEADITSWVNGTWSNWKNNTLSPSITLTDLSINTSYYYRIESTDDYGNVNSTDIPVQSFTTAFLNMEISTNRIVILDDPMYAGSNAAPGFENPPDPVLQQNWTGNDWNNDYWKDESTTIRAYVLVMDVQGMGADNTPVNFTLKNPAGIVIDQSSSITDSGGIASYLFDMNNKNYWGTWIIEVNSTVDGKFVHSSTDYILNWWGCALCHGDPGPVIFNQTLSMNGNATNPDFPIPNSPYAMGYDMAHQLTVVGGNMSNYHGKFYSIDYSLLGWYGNGHENYSYNPVGYSQFPDTKCVHCHQGYDGYPGGNTSATYIDFRQDYHNFSCDSHACHAVEGRVQPYQSNFGIPEMKSCGFQFILPDDGGIASKQPQCHAIWGDIYDVPYVAGGNGNVTIVSTLDDNNNDSNDQARVNYSDSIPASGDPLRLHTLNDKVPCVLCHGPNHGIRNPDPSTFERRLSAVDEADKIATRFADGCVICHQPEPTYKNPESTCEVCHVGLDILPFEQNSNGTTEISHCQTCHTKKQHNASVDCTVCHSQDAHIIKYFDINGDYSPLQSNAGNCTTCHQNNKLSTILANPKAGTYSGNAPLVNDPTTHSVNSINGTLWDRGVNFWVNTSQVTTCLYCHGNTTHESTALGYPGIFQGINIVGGDLSGSWCGSCHYQNNTNYDVMAGTMDPVPPEITGNATYGNYTIADDGTTIYFDHSNISSFNDSRCSHCHNNSATTSTGLMHGVLDGLGGPDCILCHEGSGVIGTLTINMTLFNQSPHANINNGNATNNKHCYMCHRDGTAPIGATGQAEHISKEIRYNASDRSCADTECHGNTSSSIYVGSHFDNATQYGRFESGFVRTSQTCEFCHGKTQVPIFNESIPGNGSNISMVLDDGTGPTGHYVRNIVDGDSHYVVDTVGWEVDGKNGSQGCVYCHKDQSEVFGATNISSWANHSTFGNNCYRCHINGTTYLHDLGVITASGGTPDCLGCHGLGRPQEDINETAFGLSIHKDLNTNATNVTVLNNTLSKTCWACHGNGSEPGGHINNSLGPNVPANTTRPLNCSEAKCHVNGTAIYNVTINGTQPISTIEHIPGQFRSTLTDIIAVDCTLCHKNSLTYNNDTKRGLANESDASNVSHYGSLTTTNISAVKPTTDCTLCHKNTTNNVTWGGAMQVRHPVNKSTSFCVNCHGSGTTFHAENLSTVPEIHSSGFDWEGDGIDSFSIYPPLLSQDMEGCFACHNGTVDFATMGQDIDDDNSRICEECHYNNSVGPFTINISMRSDVSDTIPRVYNHINDSANATVVIRTNLTASSTSQLSSPSTCFNYNNNTGNGACHGVSYENRTDAGGYYAFNNYEISMKASTNMSPYRYTQTIDHMPNTTDCRICHLGANSSVGTLVESSYWGNPMNVSDTKPTIPTHININAQIGDCWACHVFGGVQPLDFHDVNITGGGGPDCISCHDVGRSGATSWVNVSALNGSLNGNASIHYAINNATTGTGGSTGNPDNQICWACHQSDGSEPSGMGDIFEDPYKCYDCHDGTAPYTNVSNAPGVFQHFVNGSALKAASNAPDNSSSCLVCHNLTEMKVEYSEGIDTYSTNYSIPSHYGRNRSSGPDSLRTGPGNSVNCSYCHQTPGNNFTSAMVNINNASVPNHSLAYNATTPYCTECHNGGWMHNASLYKPTNLTIESSGLCLSCHGDAKSYTGPMVTSNKSRHNNSLDCTQCHINTSKRDIHGIKYLQTDGSSYTTVNTTAVNCTTCHQDNASAVNQSLNPIPLIQKPMYHSEDPMAGRKWNDSYSPYWNNTNEACEYCHNATLHEVDALGNLASLRSNTTDLSDYICASCHKSGSAMYSSIGGNANFSKTPPEITLTINSNDGTFFYNHSTLSDFIDSICKGCHGNSSNPPQNTTIFAHDVYGANITLCINCHDAPLGLVPTTVQLNVSATNNGSESIHYNLNSAASDDNLRCYACHANGSAPSSHPSLSDAKLCDECHVTLNFSAPLVGRHIPNASAPQQFSTSNITTNYAQCWNCHNNSVNSSATMWQNNRSLVSHYGTNSSLVRTNSNSTVDECYNCHWNTTNQYKYGNAPQTQMASQIQCYECHNGDWKFERRMPGLPEMWVFYSSEPGDLHNQQMGTYWACSTCH